VAGNPSPSYAVGVVTSSCDAELTSLTNSLYHASASLLCVVCLAEQKVDEQNSMDTSHNDNEAEHSLPNSSEVAEVMTCSCDIFLLTSRNCGLALHLLHCKLMSIRQRLSGGITQTGGQACVPCVLSCIVS